MGPLPALRSVTVEVDGELETRPGPVVTVVFESTKPLAIGVAPSVQVTAVALCEQVVDWAFAVPGKATKATAPHKPKVALLSRRSRTDVFFMISPVSRAPRNAANGRHLGGNGGS